MADELAPNGSNGLADASKDPNEYPLKAMEAKKALVKKIIQK
jgi:hypothetical protein